MTDSPIDDLEGLLSAFGVDSVDDLAHAIDEAADSDDGRDVFIDVRGPGVTLGIGTRGIDIEFPTTVRDVLDLAAELERMLDGDPFEVIPGDPHSTVIIHVPHSSRAIPDDVRAGIALDVHALEAELDVMTDSFTDVIAEKAAGTADVRPWLFVNRRSRLVVDPERFPDEREEMNAVGMGAVYTLTSAGNVLREPTDDEVSGLVDRFFTPYADALSQLASERLAAAGQVTIIDLHSFPLEALPYELHGDGARPEICLGTDEFHTPPGLSHAARDAFNVFDRGQDSPFSGCYVPLAHYQSEPDVTALMIEVRRDLYMDAEHDLVEESLTPIVEAMGELIDGLPERVLEIRSREGMFDPLPQPTSREHE